MTFAQSIAACFTRYTNFNGRASRSEFWWFVLFIVLASAALSVVSWQICTVFQILIILPLLAAGARRLHDTDRSGWLQLLSLVPVAGVIVMVIFFVQPPKEPNRFGDAQTGAGVAA